MVGGCEEDRARLNCMVEKAAVLCMQALLISDTETASFDTKCKLRAVVPELRWDFPTTRGEEGAGACGAGGGRSVAGGRAGSSLQKGRRAVHGGGMQGREWGGEVIPCGELSVMARMLSLYSRERWEQSGCFGRSVLCPSCQ